MLSRFSQPDSVRFVTVVSGEIGPRKIWYPWKQQILTTCRARQNNTEMQEKSTSYTESVFYIQSIQSQSKTLLAKHRKLQRFQTLWRMNSGQLISRCKSVRRDRHYFESLRILRSLSKISRTENHSQCAGLFRHPASFVWSWTEKSSHTRHGTVVV